MKKYQIIYADPPWKTSILRVGKDKGRGFDNYNTMRTEDICAIPVIDISDANSSLFLWATNTFLPDALQVMYAWGFKYHCVLTWDKQYGITMRGFHRVTEFLLFGYKGSFPCIGEGVPIKTLISVKRLRHSQKPSLFRDIISQKFIGDKIELFARERVDGWGCWGNEVDSDIEL